MIAGLWFAQCVRHCVFVFSQQCACTIKHKLHVLSLLLVINTKESVRSWGKLKARKEDVPGWEVKKVGEMSSLVIVIRN